MSEFEEVLYEKCVMCHKHKMYPNIRIKICRACLDNLKKVMEYDYSEDLYKRQYGFLAKDIKDKTE